MNGELDQLVVLATHGSEDSDEYERCSAELYRSVLDGLVASTNAGP